MRGAWGVPKTRQASRASVIAPVKLNGSMSKKRPPKKSELLAARVPYEIKRAFLKACAEEGRSPSDVIRGFIERHVRRAEARARLRGSLTPRRSLVMAMKTPYAQGGAIAAGLGALALFAFGAAPSVAEFDYRASFQTLDTDGDGAISLDEYASAGAHSTIAVEFDLPDGAPPPELGADENAEVLEFEFDGSAPPAQPKVRWAYMIDIGFGETDSDGDGSVDLDEFVERHERLLAEAFARWDADQDGRLAVEEVLHDAEAPPSARGPFPREAFEAFDRNDDGAITSAEFYGGPA